MNKIQKTIKYICVIFVICLIPQFIYECTLPSKEEQIQNFSKEIVTLNIKLPENNKSKKFLREKYFSLSYKMDISNKNEKYILSRFINNNWIKKSKINIPGKETSYVFIKEQYICLIGLYDNTVELTFSYRTFYDIVGDKASNYLKDIWLTSDKEKNTRKDNNK